MRVSTWHCVVDLLLQIVLVVSMPESGPKAEALHRRQVFYAGGQYVFNSTQNGTILINQQYVEELTPASGVRQPYPLVFLHGGGISGTQWLNKGDGDAGWATFFLNRGFLVYIVDIWSVGRSSAEDFPAGFAGATVELAEIAFSAPELYKKYYQAQFHTQWPGNGTKGDPVFDDFFARFLPLVYDARQQNVTRSSTCSLLSKIGPSMLISHSAGSGAGFLATDACPHLVKGHVSAEGDQSPFGNYDAGVEGIPTPVPMRAYGIADVTLNYSPPLSDPSQFVKVQTGSLQYTDGLISQYPCTIQANSPPPRQLINVKQAPVLFLSGEASVHITYDQCTVQFLKQAGVNVTWTKLSDIGIKGNGHFSMLEKNSDEIAEYISQWIEKMHEK